MAMFRFVDDLASAYRDSLGKNEAMTHYLLDVFREIGVIREDGGEGSGNWGHEGRPGKVGGSAEGGGVHNRQGNKSAGYTSFTKQRKELAQPHSFGKADAEMIAKHKGTIVIVNGVAYGATSRGELRGIESFETLESMPTERDTVRTFVPETANSNYRVTRGNTMQGMKEAFNHAVRPTTAQYADDLYREQSAAVWKSLDLFGKRALQDYTGTGYTIINQRLRRWKASEEPQDKGQPSDHIQKEIEAMTDAIEQSELKQDTILWRSMNKRAFEKLTGIPVGSLNPDNIQDVVGRCRTDHAFISTTSCAEASVIGDKVRLQILAPKGTKALYAEPFSECGDGDPNWDGISKQESFSPEDETILQRGTSFVFLTASYDAHQGRYYFKCAIRGQRH